MKNIFKLNNGKWRFEVRENGKTIRKTFSSKSDAIDYKNSFFAARKFDLSSFTNLSGQQIDDIKNALAILPQGKTLTESVRTAWQFYSEADLHSLADEYIAIKRKKNNANLLSDDEFIHIKGRIDSLKKAFGSFADVNAETIKNYLIAKGSNKTIKNWRVSLNDFFNFCVAKDAIRSNPVSLLRADDLLVIDKNPPKIEFLSVEKARAFLEFLEGKHPQYCRFYALALFAGIRVAEIPRMRDEYFRYDERKIIFPAQIGKIKKSWTLEDLPDNLWAWLEKYKNTPIIRPSNTVRAKTFKPFNLPHNFARHSFATYHLSLYFDPAKTSKITRNSEQMLKDHYWGALVDKKTAKAYFSILPPEAGRTRVNKM